MTKPPSGVTDFLILVTDVVRAIRMSNQHGATDAIEKRCAVLEGLLNDMYRVAEKESWG